MYAEIQKLNERQSKRFPDVVPIDLFLKSTASFVRSHDYCEYPRSYRTIRRRGRQAGRRGAPTTEIGLEPRVFVMDLAQVLGSISILVFDISFQGTGVRFETDLGLYILLYVCTTD